MLTGRVIGHCIFAHRGRYGCLPIVTISGGGKYWGRYAVFLDAEAAL